MAAQLPYRQFPFIVLGALLLAGCSKLSHMSELLTLKSVSDEQVKMTKAVKATDARFEKLLKDVREKQISDRNTTRSILKRYKEPILREKRIVDGKTCDVWLYRYATQYFSSEKVYFYFDPSGKLTTWEYQKPQEEPDVKIGKETTTENASP